jgi:N-acetylmuramoyl-L-alanine amidase
VRPRFLIIHHSDSHWGDADVIRGWHLSRGFHDIGYHKVILNAYPDYTSWRTKTKQNTDGVIQQGRPDEEQGAHCDGMGMNAKSLGICLIGDFNVDFPTERQMASLFDACVRLCARHDIPSQNVLGHREADSTSCPGTHLYAQMHALRDRLHDALSTKE